MTAIFQRMDPKVDFVFKTLFGTPENKELLLSFLNATLNPPAGKEIVEVTLENTEITKKALKDKTAILDIRATTGDKTLINIEVQLVDERNIEKRTLYYWSKLYSGQLAAGQKYQELKQTITINILDFDYLTKILKSHSIFQLRDTESGVMLTDDIEIHFLELKKFDSYNPNVQTSDPLSQWMLFLKQENEKVLEVIAMTNPVINKAFNKLDVLSNDKKARAEYEQRLKSLRDRNSILYSAREEGKLEGRLEGKLEGRLEVARNAIKEGLSPETVAKIAGLPLETINDLMKE